MGVPISPPRPLVLLLLPFLAHLAVHVAASDWRSPVGGPELHIPATSTVALEQGQGLMEALFLSANTTFTYHLEQRELSYVRDRVSLDKLDRWSQAKMREIFLVPNYGCPMAARVGEWGEGGKWLCNIFPFKNGFKRVSVEKGESEGGDGEEAQEFKEGFESRFDPARKLVVYSVGSRDETSFEWAMYKLLDVKPHTFDPSLSEKKQAHMNSLEFLSFHNIGFRGRHQRTRRSSSWGPLLPITTVMKRLEHTYIDVLKIDCEGCEVGVMRDLLAMFGRKPPVGQILMEIHHLVAPWSEIELLLVMESMGFRQFHSENNERYGKAHEVAYVHESLVDPSFWPSP